MLADNLRRLIPFDTDRIRQITHHGKQVLVVDLSSCSAREVEETVRRVPDYVTTQPIASVLLLADFNGASLDEEAVRAMKEGAVFDKPYIKRSAWVGADQFPDTFKVSLEAFSGREFPTFRNRLEALNWLVEG